MTERTSKAVKQAIGIPTAILVVIYVANWAVDKFAGSQFVPRAEYGADQVRRAQFDSTVAPRLTTLEARVAELEGNKAILDALALDLCIRTTEPRIRAPLDCFHRESGR